MEREALIAASIPRIEEATVAKRALIEAIKAAESARLRVVTELAVALKTPMRELTLPKIIVAIQVLNAKLSEQLRTGYNALSLLIKRIEEANKENQQLVENSRAHIQAMKNNVLGETVPRSSTYTAKGQKSAGMNGARLIQKDA